MRTRESNPSPALTIVMNDLWNIIVQMAKHGYAAYGKNMLDTFHKWERVGILTSAGAVVDLSLEQNAPGPTRSLYTPASQRRQLLNRLQSVLNVSPARIPKITLPRRIEVDGRIKIIGPRKAKLPTADDCDMSVDESANDARSSTGTPSDYDMSGDDPDERTDSTAETSDEASQDIVATPSDDIDIEMADGEETTIINRAKTRSGREVKQTGKYARPTPGLSGAGMSNSRKRTRRNGEPKGRVPRSEHDSSKGDEIYQVTTPFEGTKDTVSYTIPCTRHEPTNLQAPRVSFTWEGEYAKVVGTEVEYERRPVELLVPDSIVRQHVIWVKKKSHIRTARKDTGVCHRRQGGYSLGEVLSYDGMCKTFFSAGVGCL